MLRHRIGSAGIGVLGPPFEVLDDPLQRIRAAIEDQILGQLPFIRPEFRAIGITCDG